MYLPSPDTAHSCMAETMTVVAEKRQSMEIHQVIFDEPYPVPGLQQIHGDGTPQEMDEYLTYGGTCQTSIRTDRNIAHEDVFLLN